MIKKSPGTKTIICIGTGGVGKTTLAASMAVGWANEGLKVLVLTIDPSQRLAQTLGIRTDGELHKVQLDASSSSTQGELWSCVINHKKAFETFIRTAAQKSKNASATAGTSEPELEKLLNNRLYQQLSGKLSGSQEFTSLITLYQHVSSQKFDLVILDTPPSQHTWNFLKAPEKIALLFNEGVTQWFRDISSHQVGFLQKMMNIGATQVLKILETLTGSEFMKELSAFFKAIQNWQSPLENYVMNCHRLLTSPETEFILVTTLDPSRLNEAYKLSREIKIQGYQLTTVVVNRVPNWLSVKFSTDSQRLNELISYYRNLEQNLQKHLTQFKTQLKVYKCFDLRQNSEDVSSLQKNFDQIQLVE